MTAPVAPDTAQKDRPALLPFNEAPIPAALRELSRWAPWRAAWSEKRGKWDKIPQRADRPEYGLSTAKPDQWFPFTQAFATFSKSGGELAGLGYLMTGPHGVVGTDLDNCRVNGEPLPWAAEIITRLNSYTEVSPSGNGYRVFGLGSVAQDWNNHDVGIEVYGGNEARFLTVTGAWVEGTPKDLRPLDAAALDDLAKRYAKERRKAEVIDLSIPDILDELLLPPLASLSLPDRSARFLTTGEYDTDRSGALHGAGVALYSAGLDDDTAFSILANSPHAMEVALDHRRQDHDRALMYLWREHCCKAKAKAKAATATADDFEDISGDVPANAPGRAGSGLRLLSMAELRAMPPVRWRVRGVLPETEVAALAGASGSGKTFLALHLAGCIATGSEFMGYQVKQAPVAYVVLEGAGGFRSRALAWETKHQVLPECFHTLMGNFDLRKPAVVAALADQLKAAGYRDGVLILDTLAQATPGADENSSEGMGHALAGSRRLQALLGGLVLVVHHHGKDTAKGMRGWSGLHGAMDAVIEVLRDGDSRSWTTTKAKDGEDGKAHPFRLEQVLLGLDDEGEAVTSCVALPGGAGVQYQVAAPRGPNQKLAMTAIKDLLERAPDSGDWPDDVPDGQTAIRLEVANEAVRDRLTCAADQRGRSAALALNGLVDRGCVTLQGGWLWL